MLRKMRSYLLVEFLRGRNILGIGNLQMHMFALRIAETIRKVLLHRFDHDALSLLCGSRLRESIQLLALNLENGLKL